MTSPSQSAPFPGGFPWSRGDADNKKLMWLTFLRVAIVTVLLGSTIVVNFSGGPALLPAYLYALIAVVYVLTLVYVYLLHKRFAHRPHSILQVGFDVAVYTMLVYLTGGAESAFTFIYSLAIINSAILLYRRGALITATLCTAVFATLVTLDASGLLPPFEPTSATAPSPTALGAFNTVFTNGAAFFFVALLSSFLDEQLRATETALAEAKGGLEDLRALSESILRSIGDGLITLTLQGNVTFANASACEILGAREEDLADKHVTEVFPALVGGDGWASALATRYREIAIERDGAASRVVLGMSTSALRDTVGAARGWMLVFHDLTILKALEGTVRRSERLAAIGRLAADMAHEIRNPLASMTGSIELMAHSAQMPAETQELMGIVMREAERLNKLISDFLDYARPHEPDIAPFDLATVLDETIWMFAHQRLEGVEAEVRSDVQGPIPMEGDPNQLKQVIWNLLKNGAEALRGKGHVTVRARRATEGAQIEVEDSGAGIAPEDLPHLFEPFFTRKQKGTGLGLATVHRIVEAHGGRIEVESHAQHGTRFKISLPGRPPHALGRSQAEAA